MLLQKLVDYSERPGFTYLPPSYSAEPVRYWIELDRNGRLLGVITVEESEGKRPKRVPVPFRGRSSNVAPALLADDGRYVLGIGDAASKANRVEEQHRAFVELLVRCATVTDEPEVRAVLHFLEGLDRQELTNHLPQDYDPRARMSFTVDGHRPIDLLSVQDFWARESSAGENFECLICGRERPAMRVIGAKIKGIPGGQKAGLAIISANADAFESYGLTQSYIAPTCQECSDRFMKAANTLIGGENTHLRLGDVVYIFWTREDSSFSFVSLLSQPSPDDVRRLLHSVFGGGTGKLDTTPFYAAALSASGARAVVRDWIDTTVERAQLQLAQFFQRQSLLSEWGEASRPLGIFQLGRATVRAKSKDDPAPWVYKALMHHALSGGPLPAALLYKAVERCRLEHGVNEARAVLIKLVLLSRDHTTQAGGTSMAELDTTNREPAYLCGRLFAELEATQRAALNEVGANIVDRYYGTASSAPATVFGRLVRGAQPHLGKLRREREWLYRILDARLQEIMVDLPTFPTTLNLEQQGIFALGYYHQKAADRQEIRERRDRKAGEPAEEEER